MLQSDFTFYCEQCLRYLVEEHYSPEVMDLQMRKEEDVEFPCFSVDFVRI